MNIEEAINARRKNLSITRGCDVLAQLLLVHNETLDRLNKDWGPQVDSLTLSQDPDEVTLNALEVSRVVLATVYFGSTWAFIDALTSQCKGCFVAKGNQAKDPPKLMDVLDGRCPCLIQDLVLPIDEEKMHAHAHYRFRNFVMHAGGWSDGSKSRGESEVSTNPENPSKAADSNREIGPRFLLSSKPGNAGVINELIVKEVRARLENKKVEFEVLKKSLFPDGLHLHQCFSHWESGLMNIAARLLQVDTDLRGR